jgi:ArsR family transcriptional regulator
LAALKAAGEVTRLRILVLLEVGELNVSDLTSILDQSQPRISRHLRLLAEAGLIERFREGSFVYCRLAQKEVVGELVNRAISLLEPDEPVLANDRQRAARIRKERFEASQIWFKANAAKWDQIRSLYVAESKVEAAMLELLPKGEYDCLLDLGTGTGRMLELFADRVRQAIGFDASHSMLDYARSRLAGKRFEHCQVRQGDLVNLAYGDGLADIVILHQVLHFLIEPEKAIQEAARLLQPGGQLLIVDFAPHNLDFLREEFAHERLGFSGEQISVWLKKAGLTPGRFRQLAADKTSGDQKLMVSLWLAQKTGETKSVGSVAINGQSGKKRLEKMQGSMK